MLHRLLCLFLCCAGLLVPLTTRASHAQGGDLSYRALGNNQYEVTCRFFRDCSGIQAPPSMVVNARMNGCFGTAPGNLSATLQRVVGPVYGTQYCATTTGLCTATGPANFEENVYQGTITLPPNQWTLSVEENARPTLANIPGNTTLRFEATLDNRTGLQNSTPVHSTHPVSFLNWQQNITMSLGAYDTDGDSLVYSLEAPLDGCNDPSTYSTLNSVGGVILDPSNSPTNPCVIQVPVTTNFTYSPTYPLPSFQAAGSCPIRTATPYFLFNAASGAMTFTPALYFPSPSADGKNKYAVVVRISEYRRLNGAYQLIATSRRELLVVVVDCGPNQNPRFASTVRSGYGANMTTQPLSQTIPVLAGEPHEVELTFSDANAGQVATLVANRQNLPGVTMRQAGTNTVRVSFQSSLTTRNGLYYVPVMVEDDNCPLKGFETQVLAFRIYGSVLDSRTPKTQVVSTAYPNPFVDQVTFTLAQPASRQAQVVEVYNQLGQLVDQFPAAASATPELTVTWRPATALPAGVYTARLAGGSQSVRLLHSPQH